MGEPDKKAPEAPPAAADPAVTAAPEAASTTAPAATEATTTAASEAAEKSVAPEPNTAPTAAPASADTGAPATEAPKEAESKPAEPATSAAPADASAPAATVTEAPKAAEPKPAETPAAAAPAATATETPKPAEAKPTEAPAPAAAAAAASAASKPINDLWAAAKAHGHPEIWGVTLADPDNHVPSQIVFQKYLNANDGDLAKAKDQLTKTLDWRAKTKPLELVQKKYNKAKFGGLGYVTTYTAEGSDAKEVFTWNIYGNVKSIEETFGKLDEFIEWRVALMELAVHELSLATATEPITADRDPYKIYQVHDYKSISFLRQAPSVKTASKETITILAANYPELLKEKFFVNVPAVMGFMYGIIKLFVAAKTLKKFHPMSNGAALAREFGASKVSGLGDLLPKAYGGKGAELEAVSKQTSLEE